MTTKAQAAEARAIIATLPRGATTHPSKVSPFRWVKSVPGTLVIRLRTGGGVQSVDEEAVRVMAQSGTRYVDGYLCHSHGAVYVGPRQDYINHPEAWCLACKALFGGALNVQSGSGGDGSDRFSEVPVAEMDEKSGDSAVEAAVRPGRCQGFEADAAVRSAIEARAMAIATEEFSRFGWHVDSSPALTMPYDLECTRDGVVLRIEVKGTRGAGESVLVTIGEVRVAREEPESTVLCVVSAIKVDYSEEGPVGREGEPKFYTCWNPSDEDLEPLAFRYALGSLTPGSVP